MQTSSVWRAVAYLLSVSAAGSALAATTTALPAVDVSASRTAADVARLPVGTVIIDRTQLDKMPVTNLAEALRSVGGVSLSQNFYGNVSGSYGAPDLMGFGVTAGQNTLILLNGRRLNTMDSSSVNLGSIPLSAIDHIEILPGSGSVLYGNGAVGGVINIITRQHYGNHGRLEATMGELNTRGGAAQGSFSQGAIDGIVSVGRLLSDNYRDNNASSQSHAFGDLRYSGDNASYYLTTSYGKQTLGLPGTVSNTGLAQDPTQAQTPNDWAEDKTLRILPGASYTFDNGLDLHLDAGFRERKQSAAYYSFGTSLSESVDRTLSVSPRLLGEFQLGVGHHWTAGVDYTRSRYRSNTFYGDETYQRSVRSLYAQDSLSLTDSTWLTLGARHEWVRTTKDNGQLLLGEPDEQVGMWSIGVRQALSEMVSLFAKVERNARYATLDELRPLSATQSPLATQTGKLYSLGASWQKGAQYSTLTLWQGKYHNEIAYDPAANVGGLFPGANVNLDSTKREGVSLNSYWQLDKRLWLAISGTYQEAKFDTGSYAGNWVPVVPRVSAYARIDWQPLAQLTLSLAERYQGKQYYDNDQSNSFGEQIPSCHFMDISATYRPTGAKSVYVSAILHNAENKQGAYDYASTASWLGAGGFTAYPLPGRYLIVKAGVDF